MKNIFLITCLILISLTTKAQISNNVGIWTRDQGYAFKNAFIEVYTDSIFKPSVAIQNQSTDTLFGFDMSYSIDNQFIATISLKDTLESMKALNLDSISTIFQLAGEHILKVWVSVPFNSFPDDDTVTYTISSYPYSSNLIKKAPTLDFTAAWCGSCAAKSIEFNTAVQEDTNAIPISMHINDPMSTPNNPWIIADPFANSLSVFSIDARPKGYLYSSDYLKYFIEKEAKAASPVNISATNIDIDTTQSQLQFDLNATFLHDLTNIDYRFDVMISEDSVVGGTNYSQYNFSSHTSPGVTDSSTWLYYQGGVIPCVGQPNGVWAHRYVGRYVPSQLVGDSGIIPTNPRANTTYTKRYTIPISPTWNKHKLSIIGFIEKVHIYDLGQFPWKIIVNACSAPVTLKSTSAPSGINLNSQNLLENIRVFPNPSSNLQEISFELKTIEPVFVQMYDIQGQLIGDIFKGYSKMGENKITSNIETLADGIYFYKINIQGANSYIKFIKK